MPVLSRLLLAGRRVSRRRPPPRPNDPHPRGHETARTAETGTSTAQPGQSTGRTPRKSGLATPRRGSRRTSEETDGRPRGAARPATQASRSRFPGSRPDRPSPQSQSLSRSYGSGLPTSLTYIVLFGQRLITLETCCGYRYDDQNNSPILTILHSPRFSLAGRSTPDAAAGAAHSGIHGSPS